MFLAEKSRPGVDLNGEDDDVGAKKDAAGFGVCVLGAVSAGFMDENMFGALSAGFDGEKMLGAASWGLAGENKLGVGACVGVAVVAGDEKKLDEKVAFGWESNTLASAFVVDAGKKEEAGLDVLAAVSTLSELPKPPNADVVDAAGVEVVAVVVGAVASLALFWPKPAKRDGVDVDVDGVGAVKKLLGASCRGGLIMLWSAGEVSGGDGCEVPNAPCDAGFVDDVPKGFCDGCDGVA